MLLSRSSIADLQAQISAYRSSGEKMTAIDRSVTLSRALPCLCSHRLIGHLPHPAPVCVHLNRRLWLPPLPCTRPMKTLTVLSLLLLTLGLSLSSVTAQDLPDNAADLPISHLLSLASSALSAGRSASALEVYDHILQRDKSDVATLYKRATVRLAINQLHKAKEGFKEVLAVKEFGQARLQLARICAKLGEYQEARREVDLFLKTGESKEGAELVCRFSLSRAGETMT